MGRVQKGASAHNAVDMLMGLGDSQTTGPATHPAGSAPIFISSESSSVPSSTASHDSANESHARRTVYRIPKNNVEVRVPRIVNASDYHPVPYDPTVIEVLEEYAKRGEVYFSVKNADGDLQKVSHSSLISLPGGRIALDDYQPKLTSSSSESDLIERRPKMPLERRVQPTRRVQANYVDISQIDLSGNEDDRPPKRQKRSLLSEPRGRAFWKYQSRDTSDSEAPAEASDSETEPDPGRRKKLPLRSLRSTRSAGKAPQYDDSLLESSETDSNRRTRGRKPKLFGTEPTRRSGRAGRQTGNMREMFEDDIPEADSQDQNKARPKYHGAKEVFKTLPKTDEFRLRHCQSCDTCNILGDDRERGRLVYCQGCTLSFHTGCLGSRNNREHLVTKVADEDFVLQCKKCVEHVRRREPLAPRQSKCQECHQTSPACHPFRPQRSLRDEQKEREENGGKDPAVNVQTHLLYQIKNVLFRCSSCYNAFHMQHLPSQVENFIEADDEDEKASQRFAQYNRTWTCHDCSTAPALIGGLIAWRPVDLEQYTTHQTVEQVPEDNKEYLIKWHNKSYYRSTWHHGAWVWAMTKPAMRAAFARRDEGINLPKMRTEDAIPEEYLRVDIVFDVKYSNVVNTRVEEVELARIKEVDSARVKFKGLSYEDVVWEEPPSPNDTERWADFKAAYTEWVRGRYIHLPSDKSMYNYLRKAKALDFQTKVVLKEQPESLKGPNEGKLMDYQIDGVNWLLYQWHSNQNAILADEMGLGKTIQVIAFMATLQERYHICPFLIVVPNATCANWRREIKLWAPSLRVVTYFGSSKSRDLAYKHEMFPEKPGDLRCHVVVTSYDAAQDDSCNRVFKKINWAAMIVDEGQRLKNDKNLLYNALTQVRAPFKMLLTGTPLQNNQRELFNLLQFLDDKLDAAHLETQYADLTKENVAELHGLLRPFFLRRTKAQVLTFLPPMAQIIVPVSMTALQKQLYKNILTKNADLLKSIFAKDSRSAPIKGLRNILMDLRKCLCHPFVYNLAIEERSNEPTTSHRQLVEASAKLRLLEIMLPMLKERGHRVLIFSQFLGSLTIMEDFLAGLSLEYLRLDGSLGSLEKQKCIDAFNAPGSPIFAFLLSTRAGGVGINLATADTVIILDPDFNPHQDIQAISRAHRIGQKKKVLIFQLMTRESPEEKIMQMGKKKMALDHVLIEQMAADDTDGHDLESVLRFGAEALFKDEETQDIHYAVASVEKLLDRSQMEDTSAGQDKSAESQFSFARIWQNKSGSLEEGLQGSEGDNRAGDGTVWAKILAERAKQSRLEEAARAEALGRGKRQRGNVNYGNSIDATMAEAPATSDGFDTDFHAPSSNEESGPESDNPIDAAAELGVRANSQKPPNKPSKPPSQPPKPRDKPYKPRTSPKSVSFQRAQVAPDGIRSFDLPQPVPVASQNICLACNFQRGTHESGKCPLKRAGVEFCNLCGIAHYGMGRTCPHLQSETQVSYMLRDLKNSPEPKELVSEARRILNGIKGSLVQGKKLKREKQAMLARSANPQLPQTGGNVFSFPQTMIHPHAAKVHANSTNGTAGGEQGVNPLLGQQMAQIFNNPPQPYPYLSQTPGQQPCFAAQYGYSPQSQDLYSARHDQAHGGALGAPIQQSSARAPMGKENGSNVLVLSDDDNK